ncbi:signal transducer and activator of transcription 5B-like isoform X2 [Tigriopus californicus]|uniref:signal transducer and activator of transcription 5B-like isoform X2 n=1 Tax=Tigriopus californicus TaxID=6832 RepID=UPI0027DA511D|nr:signal transducer and activator of transcription 5B-like isoform X2 [Tigriopus californicus]
MNSKKSPSIPSNLTDDEGDDSNHYFGPSSTMLWDQTKQLPPDLLAQVQLTYQEHFPLEVRLNLASWIEEKFAPSIPFNVEDKAHQKTAVSLANQLISQLDGKIASMPNDPEKFLLKGKLTEIAANLKATYANNPIGLYMAVRHCLEQEMIIVQKNSANTSGGEETADISNQIRQHVLFLQQQIGETSDEYDRIKEVHEAFTMEYCEFEEKSKQLGTYIQTHGEQYPNVKSLKASKEALQKSVQLKYSSCTEDRKKLIHTYSEMLVRLQSVIVQVLDNELINWKREQQLAGNGHSVNTATLELLQNWCDNLATVVWTMRKQLKQLEELVIKVPDQQNSSQDLKILIAKVTELLSNLVTSTFVIEKQPPQVMKTNTRFTATVRLLVGGALNVHMVAPTVSVSIVSEAQANQLLSTSVTETKRKENFSSGQILNDYGAMEFNNANRQVSVLFRNLQLKKIKRTEKKGTESVMDEKFSVLFWTEFLVGELNFQLWTLSLPVVVIVHGNQEAQALATVTWDNAFAEWGRRPFVVPDKVSWKQAGEALSMKWAAACGSGLKEEHLYYLACKAFRDPNLPRKPEEYNSRMLSWSQFCKEVLPDRTFTFWEWFHRILSLTSNHMQRLWKENYVLGFIKKHDAENLLKQKQQNGCFLLRFSDSELGGVTIAYLTTDPYQHTPQVSMVAPFTTKDLSQRSMADTIFDLDDLTFLYPDIPKDAFKKFCSSSCTPQNAPNGYVAHKLVTQVAGGSGSMSNPPTPIGYDQIYMGGSQCDAQASPAPSLTTSTSVGVASPLSASQSMDFDSTPQTLAQSIEHMQRFHPLHPKSGALNSSATNPPAIATTDLFNFTSAVSQSIQLDMITNADANKH